MREWRRDLECRLPPRGGLDLHLPIALGRGSWGPLSLNCQGLRSIASSREPHGAIAS